jgi:hypothetical protein
MQHPHHLWSDHSDQFTLNKNYCKDTWAYCIANNHTNASCNYPADNRHKTKQKPLGPIPWVVALVARLLTPGAALKIAYSFKNTKPYFANTFSSSSPTPQQYKYDDQHWLHLQFFTCV